MTNNIIPAGTIPMLSPDGQSGDVPADRAQEAISKGFKPAVAMTSPDGRLGYVPRERAAEAVRKGFTVGQPIRSMQPETGDPVLNDLGQMARDTAKNTYQVSAPGIAASFLEKYRPGTTANLPSGLQPAKAEDLGNQIAVTALPMFAGAAEAPYSKVTAAETATRPAAAATEGAAGELAQGIALRIAKRIPYVGKAIRLGELASDVMDAIQGDAPKPQTAPAPQVPPWWGKSNVGPVEQWGTRIEAQPQTAAPQAPAVAPVGPGAAPAEAGISTVPRTLSGESVLNDTLTGLDNKTLLKVARSRGIDVTKEAQLKPGVADVRVIRKIIDDFTPDELDDVRNIGIEQGRFTGAHNYTTSAVAREAWHNKVLATYFPDVKIPQASLNRMAAGVVPTVPRPAVSVEGMTLADLLGQSK